jgi:hypothetical protein
MPTPEVNTVGLVNASALFSSDPLFVCSVCFNLDPELIPPDQDGFLDDVRGENGTKKITTSGDVMQASAARGCISCAVLLEGVSTHCPLMDDKLIWNPRQFELFFHRKRSLVLDAIFKLISDESEELYDGETYEFEIEFYTRTS